jgi:hypothetical protein
MVNLIDRLLKYDGCNAYMSIQNILLTEENEHVIKCIKDTLPEFELSTTSNPLSDPREECVQHFFDGTLFFCKDRVRYKRVMSPFLFSADDESELYFMAYKKSTIQRGKVFLYSKIVACVNLYTRFHQLFDNINNHNYESMQEYNFESLKADEDALHNYHHLHASLHAMIFMQYVSGMSTSSFEVFDRTMFSQDINIVKVTF